MYGMSTLRAKYSLGNEPDAMINDYLDNITYLENMGEEEIGYIFLYGWWDWVSFWKWIKKN